MLLVNVLRGRGDIMYIGIVRTYSGESSFAGAGSPKKVEIAISPNKEDLERLDRSGGFDPVRCEIVGDFDINKLVKIRI